MYLSLECVWYIFKALGNTFSFFGEAELQFEYYSLFINVIFSRKFSFFVSSYLKAKHSKLLFSISLCV